ncbi:MAG: DUF2723 domain-containing protein [Ardenticatenales bacterium]|nr:DUF2723 domain-containing protein [Ardenticatenales bacterium]
MRHNERFILVARLGPALGAALFGTRLLAEWRGTSPFGAAILLVIPLGWGARRWPLRKTWPALGLLAYVFYPEPDPHVACLVAGGTLLLLTFHLATPQAAWLAGKTGHWGVAAGIFAGTLLLYSPTIATGILPADNGEFQLVAARLGIAHPPGFPLYTLLGHLAAHFPLPVGVAFKINALSALISAATLLLVHLSVVAMTGRKSAGILAALALGTATTFWAQATIANVRSLTAFFAALALYALIHLERALREKAAPRHVTRMLALLILALSLGVTHHASLVFMGGLWLLAVLWWMPALLTTPRRWPPLLLVGLVGLLPLLYLPLRAAAGAWGTPPDLTTWSGFWNHVLARGFAGDFFYFVQPAILWQRLCVMGNVLTFQFSPWLLAGMGLGLLRLLRANRRLAWVMGGGFLLHTMITAMYRAPQTVEYMMPAYIPLALCLGYALQIPPKRRALAALLTTALLLAGLWQAADHWRSYAHTGSARDTIDYTNLILENAPAEATILANWHWVTPLWYAQEVLGARPDLRIRYVPPGGEPYAQTWANEIAAELAAGQDVIATWYNADAYAALPPPEPLGEAFWFRQTPRTALPADFAPLDLQLGSAHVRGYALQPAAVPIGAEAVLTVAWETTATSSTPTNWYAHVRQEDGSLVAQGDVPAFSAPTGLTLTQLRLTPRLGAPPGETTIYLGVAGAAEPARPLAALTILPMSRPPITAHPTFRTLPSGRPLLRLVGYDWDTTLPGQTRLYLHWQTEQGYQTEVRDNVDAANPGLPDWFGPWGQMRPFRLRPPANEHYVPLGAGIVWTGGTLASSGPLTPGRSVTVSPVFRAQNVVQRDLVVSLRLVGYEEDGFHWAWWDLGDSVPALGGIPTLKWIAGSQIRDPHPLRISPDATPGQTIDALLRLYDAFTQRPLPILDERLTAAAIWIPTGPATISQRDSHDITANIEAQEKVVR